MKWCWILALGVAAAVPAQNGGPRRIVPYPIFDAPGWEEAVLAGTRTRTGEPGPRYWTDSASYRLEVEIEPATAAVLGRGVVTYRNRSPRRLDELVFHLRQNLHRREALRNTAVEITGGMTVTGITVRVGDGALRKPGRTIDGTILRVPVALDPGEEATLEMEWSFQVPRAGQAPRMGHEDHHVYWLGYWYPQLAVHEDVGGWVADPYLGNGEFYMGWADYDVSVTLPHGFLVRATGELENASEVLPEDVRARLDEAARGSKVVAVVPENGLGAGKATVESPDGKLRWRFRASNVRDFAISASDRYRWDACAARVPGPGGGGERRVMIHALYERNARTWTRGAAWCRHTIEFLSRWLFPYPWPHMTACEGIVGGGMEYPMMTVVGDIPFAPGLHAVIAHETIHMWFPMVVGSNETAWAWMDEGLTDFCTDLCLEDDEPGAGRREETLANYRRGARAGGEVEAMRHADAFPASRPGAYPFASYTKTAAALHQLRAQLGAEAFDEALRAYVRRWAFRHPHPRDLFSTFSGCIGEDLDWYFRTWLFETWTLDQRIAGVEFSEDASVATVEDLGTATGPSVLEALYGDGRKERKRIPARTWLDGATRVRLDFGPDLKSLRLDPDGTTLDLDPANNAWSR